MKGKPRIINIVIFSLVFQLGLLGLIEQTYGKELKIAVITALSGAGAEWGRGVLHGAELAADEANARGGIDIGGEKYKIKIIAYDDKYTGAGGAAAAHKAVFEDKVQIIIGSISSASVLAFQDITEKNKILVLANSWARDVLKPEKPYTFRMFMTSTQIAPGLVEWVKKVNPDIKTCAIVAPNDASGWSVSEDYIREYEKAGIKVVAKEFPERGTKDYYPMLNRIKALNPGAIQDCALGVGAVAILTKQIRELGINALPVGGATIDPDLFVKLCGKKEAEGFVYPSIFDVNSKKPIVVNFLKNFRKKYGEKATITYVDPSFYDAANLLFEALKKAGSTDATKVRDALETIKEFEGVNGKLEFGGKETYGIDHQLYQSYYIAQIKDGKETILGWVR
jgi:branched-chain amino acid transport system substrate-binding protein